MNAGQVWGNTDRLPLGSQWPAHWQGPSPQRSCRPCRAPGRQEESQAVGGGHRGEVGWKRGKLRPYFLPRGKVRGCSDTQLAEHDIPVSGVGGPLCILTTVTASLSRDSPKTIIKRVSLTCTSSKTASTATGSTAEMRLPNSKKSSRPAWTRGAMRERQKTGLTEDGAASNSTPGTSPQAFLPGRNKTQGDFGKVKRLLAYILEA